MVWTGLYCIFVKLICQQNHHKCVNVTHCSGHNIKPTFCLCPVCVLYAIVSQSLWNISGSRCDFPLQHAVYSSILLNIGKGSMLSVSSAALPPFQDDSSWQNIVEQLEGCSTRQSSREEVERANDDVYFPPHIYGALLLPHCWLLVYMLSFVLAEWIYFKHYWDNPLMPATFMRGFSLPSLPV